MEDSSVGDSVGSKEINLNIITLNCWGLKFFSQNRIQRIYAIAKYLNEQRYDLVFLQELWVRSDFDLIKETTSTTYKFAHLFSTKSIIGTSGLAILSKWHPQQISYMPYSVNGSPFKPWHGDWFTGKGTAYAKIELRDLRIHLFCTHLHAQYCKNEALGDQYSIHRICQSYQLGKFINMTRELVSDVGRSSDLFILAGDLNFGPDEFPFQLLEAITGLKSCFNEDGLCAADSNSGYVTHGHLENTYTKTHDKPKLIDFIFYKLVNKRGCDRTVGCHQISASEKNLECFSEQIQCLSKDPCTGYSFSDHQPVAVRLKISKSPLDFVPSNPSVETGYVNCSTKSGNGCLASESSQHQHDKQNSETVAIKSYDASKYLEKATKLMKCYYYENKLSKQKLTYSICALGIASIVSMFMANAYQNFLSLQTFCLLSFVVILLLFMALFLLEIVFRYEQHAICTIIEDITCSAMPKNFAK